VIELARVAETVRTTRETRVAATVDIDGTGATRVKTAVPFLDHLLVTLGTHSLIDVEVEATGDLTHHIVEDVALTLGNALSKALGNREGIMRFGAAVVPMDEASAIASVDLARRPFSVIELELKDSAIEGLKSEDTSHFLASLATSLEANLHVKVLYGGNDHHKVEAAFKALALSLRQACNFDAKRSGPPSTKGAM
jgi:imidazoleglycerol-phosphate dehydratase